MRKMGENKKIILLGVIATLVLGTISAGCSGGSGGSTESDNKASAVEMRIQRAVGTVKLANDKGEDQTIMEQMRLNAGSTLSTAKESLAEVSLDLTRLVTIEESSKAQINGDSRNLEISCTEGNLFVNVNEKVAEGSTVDVRVGNTICGFRGTSLLAGIDKNGNITIMETDGVSEITITDDKGNKKTLTLNPKEKMVITSSGSSSEPAVTVYTEEDLPPFVLYAISKDPELKDRVVKATGFSGEKITAIAEVLCRINSENEAVPIMGHEGGLLTKAAGEARDISGKDLALEIAILTGVKNAMEAAVKKGASDEELTKISEIVIDTMERSVADMKDGKLTKEEIIGVVGEIDNAFKKVIDESSPQNREEAIKNLEDRAKEIKDIVKQRTTTGTTGEALEEAIRGQAQQSTGGSGTGNTQGNGSVNPGIVPQGGNTGNLTDNTTALTDDDDDDDYGGGGRGNSGNKKKKDKKEEEKKDDPDPKPTPKPDPDPNKPDDDDEEEEEENEQTDETGTTGNAVHLEGNIYQVSLSNGSSGTINLSEAAAPKLNISSYGGSAVKMPVTVKFQDRGDVVISSITSLSLDEGAEGAEIQGVTDTAPTMDVTVDNWTASSFTVKSSTTTITDNDGEISAEVKIGSLAKLNEFSGLWGTCVSKATFGGIEYTREDNSDIITGSGFTISVRDTVSSTDDYLEISGISGGTGGQGDAGNWRLHVNGTITKV